MADLPKDIWATIMTHLPQAQRLGACSLVCGNIRAAAAEATTSVSVACAGDDAQQRVESVGSYLQHHGAHVMSLKLNYTGKAHINVPPLPCAQLVHLDLSVSPVFVEDEEDEDGIEQFGTLQLLCDPTSELPGVVHSCTALTSLKLSSCVLMASSADPLASLSLLVNLVDLRLADLNVWRTGAARSAEPVPFPGSILLFLSCLTCIDLWNVGVDDVHCVSQLQCLCVLSITQVPLWLKQLRLAPDISPDFVLPSSLQRLALGGRVVLNPAVLSVATQLSALELSSLEDVEGEGGVVKGAALLAAVSKLQRLKILSLHAFSFDATAWPPLSAAYEALTASSMLFELRVYTRVPAGLWSYALPTARRMDKMESFASGGMMSAEEMSRVVACCPGLLQVEVCMDKALFLTALQPLTALTRLRAIVVEQNAEDDIDFGGAVQALAALTSLRVLSANLITVLAEVSTRSVLLSLTALRQLTSCYVLAGLKWGPCEQAAMLPGAPLWLKLLQYCMQDTSCRLAIKASLEHELAQLEEGAGGGQEERQALQGQIEQFMEQLEL